MRPRARRAVDARPGRLRRPAIPAATPLTTAAAATTSYKLGSGDRVRVVVFRHETLSGEFALDGAGHFAMPLIGEVQAGGLTTRELEAAESARS